MRRKSKAVPGFPVGLNVNTQTSVVVGADNSAAIGQSVTVAKGFRGVGAVGGTAGLDSDGQMNVSGHLELGERGRVGLVVDVGLDFAFNRPCSQ